MKTALSLTVGLVIVWSGLLSPFVAAQEKDDVGLVIGATITPDRGFRTGTVGSVSFNPSLALGAEYDRKLFGRERFVLSGGVDFVASPLDVRISNPPLDSIGEYAYIFLTPHVRLKFRPGRAVSPWVLVGGWLCAIS